jgi:hypothetical protein
VEDETGLPPRAARVSLSSLFLCYLQEVYLLQPLRSLKHGNVR